MFTNGSTAMDCGGGAKAVGATLVGTAGGFGGEGGCLDTQNVSMVR
jgi:hypothetical protein